MVRFAKAPTYYETEESSMKDRKILSLLLAGTMTATLLAAPAQAAEQQPQTPAPYAISFFYP
jgi:hypothetical protein